MELIHTCYRIGEIDRSVAFYEALGFEERRRMPIRDEAINVFMGLPGDGDRLELTYNHGVDSYELGTGYNHIALTVDDINGTLERLGEQGIEPEKPPYRVREGGSLIAFVRDPDGYRIELIEKNMASHAGESRLAVIDCGSNSFRLVVFTYTDSWWKRTDEIHESVRVGEGLEATGELRRGADGARAGDARALRALLRGDRDRRRSGPSRPRRSATRPTRRSSWSARYERSGLEVEVLSGEAEARYGYLAAVNSTTLSQGVVLDLGGGSMQLTRVEEREAADGALVAARRRAHDRALPARPRKRAKRKQIKALREHVAAEIEPRPGSARAAG